MNTKKEKENKKKKKNEKKSLTSFQGSKIEMNTS